MIWAMFSSMDATMWIYVILCANCLVITRASSGIYSKHQLLRVIPTNFEQVKQLDLLRKHASQKVDVWSDLLGVGIPQLIRVPPESQEFLNQTLYKIGLYPTVAIQDIQSVIDSQAEEASSNRHEGLCGNIDLEQYNRYNDIDSWLDTISGVCGSRCSVFPIGTSHEGRTMRVIKVTGTADSAQGSVFVDAGYHGQEWIAPAALLWMIDKFVREYSEDLDLQNALDRFDWYFLPVANPDGYEFTHVDDRLWSKTRKPNLLDVSGNCPGTDLNRNFDVDFGGSGSSSEMCSYHYHGDTAFSEPEATAIADMLTELRFNITAYFSFHSYGQFTFHPWGFFGPDPPNIAELQRISNIYADTVLPLNGRVYIAGTKPQFLWELSGCSTDWALDNLFVPYEYHIKLPDRGLEGDHGYLLPASMIKSVGEEVTLATIAMAKEMNTSLF